MLNSEMTAADLYLSIGILAQVSVLENASDGNHAEFATIRDSSRLLPEKLVELLNELRLAGLVSHEENDNGNPYGLIRLTEAGRNWVNNFGDEAESMIERAPQQYKVSTPERSTRRGGKRSQPNDPSPRP